MSAKSRHRHRIAIAAQALRGRPRVPRPGELIFDHAGAGERIEIARVLARDGMSWRVLDSRGQVLSIEATRTSGVWLSCEPPNLPIKPVCETSVSS